MFKNNIVVTEIISINAKKYLFFLKKKITFANCIELFFNNL